MDGIGPLGPGRATRELECSDRVDGNHSLYPARLLRRPRGISLVRFGWCSWVAEHNGVENGNDDVAGSERSSVCGSKANIKKCSGHRETLCDGGGKSGHVRIVYDVSLAEELFSRKTFG